MLTALLLVDLNKYLLQLIYLLESAFNWEKENFTFHSSYCTLEQVIMGDDINNEVEWHNDTILRMCGDNKLDWEAREKLNSHFPGSETQQAQYHFNLTLYATCCTLTWIFQKIGVYRFYFICRRSNTVLKLDDKLLWNLFNSVHALRQLDLCNTFLLLVVNCEGISLS